jgi:hypothetical protein
MNSQKKIIRLIKCCIAAFFLLSGLLSSVNSMAQVLYENEDNIVVINIPGTDPSKLAATAEGGTIVRKGTDQWIARPSREEVKPGLRKNDFIITVFTTENGKNKVLTSKTYEVKTAYIIDYYNEATHRLNKNKLRKYDDILLKANGIEKLCFYINNPNFVDEAAEDFFPVTCDFRFDDSSKGWLTYGIDIPFYLVITEAWDTSGKKVELPSIILTFE